MNQEKHSSLFPIKSLKSDVCIVGGGMAGICAALAAARNGASTVLIQDRPVLGGNASSEIRMWICGAHGEDNKEGGIFEELLLENVYRNPKMNFFQWDHVLYGKCLEQANLTVVLNCSVLDLTMKGSKVASVRGWHLTEQCYYEVTATMFIDCSGDSVLRASGADYRTGRESKTEFGESHAPDVPDKKTMGSSILIQLRQVDGHIPFIPPPWAYHYTDETVPKRGLFPNGDNFWWLEIGGTRDTIGQADTIRDELLKIAYGVWAYIKNHPDGRGREWELDWIGSLPGKRENVRYIGDHILTQNDIEAEGRFDDLVAYGGWPMDDHHPDGIEHPGDPTIFYPTPTPFGIPYRCLYSRNIDNLFFAGRNISATHMALSATRVMATCAIMGQAVGTASALAVRLNLSPRDIYKSHITQLQKALMEQDSYLPWHTRRIPTLSLEAKLTASAGDPAILLNGIERNLNKIDNGWWGDPGSWVQYSWPEPQKANRVRIVFDSDFTDNKRMLCRYPKKELVKTLPPMLVKQFQIEVCDVDGRRQIIHDIQDNRRRLLELALPDTPITVCRLIIGQTWGFEKAHVFAFDVR
jgi:hypothetical protein